jgi:hypothetical protein
MANQGPIATNDFVAVVPSDTTILTRCYGLYIGGTGNVVVVGGAKTSVPVTFMAVPAGTTIPGIITKVMAATAATNIVAFVNNP